MNSVLDGVAQILVLIPRSVGRALILVSQDENGQPHVESGSVRIE